MTTFVLVHGAWHGGWCWSRVARLLRERGHDVFTPTMTGLGESSHLLSSRITLMTHIKDVVGVLRWEDLEDVVLVGHSYGGMIITGAADREAGRIRSLVYLDAFVPADGESALDLRPKERSAASLKLAREKGEGWRLPPTSAATFNVNEADREWVDGKCTDLPIGCFTEPLTLTGAVDGIGNFMYIRAGGYDAPNFDTAMDRVRGKPGWTIHTLDCGHDVMVDMPAELTDLLEQAAA